MEKLDSMLQLSSAYYHQIDTQTERLNRRRSLENLLRCFVANNPRQWDSAVPEAESSKKSSVNRSTGKSAFQIVYGANPKGILDLVELPVKFKPIYQPKCYTFCREYLCETSTS